MPLRPCNEHRLWKFHTMNDKVFSTKMLRGWGKEQEEEGKKNGDRDRPTD